MYLILFSNLLFLIVSSIDRCSYTSTTYLCKENSGQGPLTKRCTSQCFSATGVNIACDMSQSDCSPYVDCSTSNAGGETMRAVNIGTTYNWVDTYNPSTTYGPDLNPNDRTDWITNSDLVYCPEKTCAIGTNNAVSAYKGMYYNQNSNGRVN